jgi:hypothetical protein
MQTVPLSAFFPTVLSIASTASSTAAEHFILQSAIEAAKRTRSIKQSNVVDAQAGVSEYPIPLQDGYSLVLIEQVSVNGICYQPTRERPCPKAPVIQEPECNKPCPSSCPTVQACGAGTLEGNCGMSFSGSGTFYVNAGTSIILDPPPSRDADGAIQVEMAVAPSRFACEIPIEFWEQWSNDIADGALSNLLLQIGTKHFKPDLAVHFQKKWERSLRRMRGQNFVNYVTGDETIRPEVNLW